MGLDLRWPIGLMFSLVGALLLVNGLLTGPSAKALGINVNLWWGLVLLVFGLLMAFSAWRSRRN
ncbi:MAG TPA: hypothetical protein PLD51_02420 [Pontiellaceae bacterium]|nr:hypothetical protein [Pontiellaceae bacterium]HPR82690.1 hypothetical protein [Pontiellaceae bacterium]